ncbi:acyl-CoA/acyl-ACP dehydrogenase [Pseudomaricurvus alkylphenolicus]|jgi:acyl-CoA dehydrogenase|uniref:acyl-CoA dehydrogenase family protein n=1 Tax=Pseudomaricurvus alkylphenolicus TaxID=1306991 RepID=UPI00141E2626|nr:acyl-CoA dehydrogenase family protein [Pseudomaricurvus alkylphenolicus]NIB38865.1 acyl-CoA/acyl-ACP dehydrogenase [Pseudomaricurvus alkylphenolicus]
MSFEYTESQQAIVDAVEKICEGFTDDYWLELDTKAQFPHEFYQAMAEGGWLGIAMPEEYGGAGLGVTEAAIMMNTVTRCSGGGYTSASTIHLNMFGPHAIVVHGTPEQKDRFLTPLIAGQQKACFGVTEPDAGLDTTSISTFAKKVEGGYRVNGRKMWTSSGQVADKILLLTRTTPKEDCAKPTDGMTIFYTDLDRSKVEVQAIPKCGRSAVDSNAVFIDDLFIPEEDRIGEEGKGFYYILDSLNPERVLVASEFIGMGMDALRRATDYANEREVFGRPIGKNQSVQHPLAESWIELEAAWLMALKAGRLYDAKQSCAPYANAAKFMAGRASQNAATRAVMTHGGMGFAKEYHVERFYRESVLGRIAPITENMILNFISNKVLGLPQSY